MLKGQSHSVFSLVAYTFRLRPIHAQTNSLCYIELQELTGSDFKGMMLSDKKKIVTMEH